MAKAYRMTARRRAALRKAQLAAARKRKLQRRRRVVGAGIALGTGALAAAVVGRKIVGAPKTVTTVRPQQALTARKTRPRGNPPGYRKTWDKKNNRWKSVPPGGVFKVPTNKEHGGNFGPNGRPTATHVQKLRPAYDAQRRKQYAQAKKKRRT